MSGDAPASLTANTPEFESFLKTCAIPLRFRLPSCGPKSVDYIKCFRSSSSQNEETKRFLASLTAARTNMVHKIQAGASAASMSDRIEAIDQYMPLIFQLFNSLNQTDRVMLDDPLKFDWRGAFTKTDELSSFPQVIWEIVMVLHTLAILEHSHAWELLASDFKANLSFAGQHFLKAANIMEYLSLSLLPMWVSNGEVSRPLEARPAVCMGFAYLFTAEAQQMAVAKATVKEGGTPSTIMTKLTIAALRAMDQGLDELKLVPPASLAFDIDSANLNRAFFAGLIYYYHADSFRTKEDQQEAIGLAIGFFRQSLERLDTITASASPSTLSLLDKYRALFPHVSDGLQHLKKTARAHLADMERINNRVYFTSVPSPTELPPLPDGALVMKRTGFQPPVTNTRYVFANPGSFSLSSSSTSSSSSSSAAATAVLTNAPASLLQSVFSALSLKQESSSSAVPSTPAAPPSPSSLSIPGPTQLPGSPTPMPAAEPPRPLSDYEIALDLQRRLDAGENC